MDLIAVKVNRKQQEADDICSLELVDVQGRALPAFSAGSHIDVHLPNGLVRQYSLCNPSDEGHRYLIAVLREPTSRGGSLAVHNLIKQGDVVQISTPRNHFELVHTRHVILLAGGIGVTPILCMAERLSQTQAQFEMHYCTRSSSRAAFKDRIATSSFAEKVSFHFDDGSAEQKLNAQAVLAAPQSDKHLFVCGPKGFMDWIIATAQALGWPEANIHREYFVAVEVDTAADDSFEVKLASTGTIFKIPKDKTIIEVLEQAGREVPTSCQQGVCGTCLTRVLEGEVDHRDLFLTDEERAANDQFTPCVSRAKAGCKRLVLDL